MVIKSFTAEKSEDFSAGATGNTDKVNFTTITLDIDVKGTDWNKLVTEGGLGFNNLYVQWSLNTPDEEYQKVQGVNGYPFPYWDERYDYNNDFAYDKDQEPTNQIFDRMNFATYLRQNELLTFTTEPSIQYMIVRWYKSETDYITDIIKLVCVQSGQTQKVKPSYVEGIRADNNDLILSAKVASKNSEVKYRVNDGFPSPLTTKIKAPEGTVSCA